MTGREFIICMGKEIRIEWDKVSHVSKYGNEVVIYTKTASYRTGHRMKEILDALPSNIFFRIHRSHIISLEYLDGYKRRRVGVNGSWLPISNYFKVRLIIALKEQIDQLCRFHDHPV